MVEGNGVLGYGGEEKRRGKSRRRGGRESEGVRGRILVATVHVATII